MEELVWRNMLQFHAGLLGIIVVCLVLFLPGGLRGAGMARAFWRQRTAEARP
jgi:branched-chain amino acid transport system permease protein